MIDDEILVPAGIAIVIAIAFLAAGYGEMLGKVLVSIAICGVTAYGVYKTKSAWCLWTLMMLMELW